MPELPEVQTTVNGINEKVKGLKILDVWTDYNSKFHLGKENIKDPRYFKKFKTDVVGTKITHATRQGKKCTDTSFKQKNHFNPYEDDGAYTLRKIQENHT